MSFPMVQGRALFVARLLVTAAFLVVTFMSIEVSLPTTVRNLVDDRRASEQLTPGQRAQAWMVAAPLPKRVIDFYRAQVEPGDRFYVQAPVTAGALNDAMIVAGYALLPAVMVARPDQANVIVSYEADPGTLPYRYASIARLRRGVSVARIADVR